MELIYILLFGIVVAAIQGLLGIAPTNESKLKENNSFSSFADNEDEDEIDGEIDDEILGVANHGNGFYKSN